MTRKYHYNNKDLTVKELVALSGIGYDAMLNRLRKGWTVDDAIKTPLHSRPNKTKIDLLESIPKADTFNSISLTKQDKVVIVGLIDDYLQQKGRGMALLEAEKRP
ncbi:hypothetical protein [Ligilactobacillus agilis]|uniref:hypothetical protein n=1 Tax=Ligilactobacillus agilis TaxID=1601 RepID=UPI001437F5B6|nr:hypothetical protein [Ligilactobacillus agilis]GET09904.1 hypothetical protein SN10121_03940 [Ligilactobacillus agilis]